MSIEDADLALKRLAEAAPTVEAPRPDFDSAGKRVEDFKTLGFHDAWCQLENKLSALACLMKEGEEITPELWDEVAAEIATLAVEDAALSLAVVRGASNKEIAIVAELKAARRRQQRPYATTLLKQGGTHQTLVGWRNKCSNANYQPRSGI